MRRISIVGLAVLTLLQVPWSPALGAPSTPPKPESRASELPPDALRHFEARFGGKLLDVVAVTRLVVTPVGSPAAGAHRATFDVKNVSDRVVEAADWHLVLHANGHDTFLGAGAAKGLAAGATASFTADFTRDAASITVEAVVDPDQQLETTAVQRADNGKSLVVTGDLPIAGLQVVALDMNRAKAAGMQNTYAAWQGSTGCDMTPAPVGANALAVNASCVSAGGLDLDLLNGFTLKNGWKVNGVQIGTLGARSLFYRHIPLAGTAVTRTILGIPSHLNGTLLFMAVQIVGPPNTQPY
jgi:hypothetical protein